MKKIALLLSLLCTQKVQNMKKMLKIVKTYTEQFFIFILLYSFSFHFHQKGNSPWAWK